MELRWRCFLFNIEIEKKSICILSMLESSGITIWQSENRIILLFLGGGQAAGAVGGALAIKEVMPKEYKHMLGGPSLKVDLQTGALAEGVLTFLISFAVLLISLRGPRSSFVKTWLLAVATVTLILAGSSYTGPSMNPANVSTLLHFL